VFVACRYFPLFEEASEDDWHGESVGAGTVFVGDVNVADVVADEGFDVVYAFGVFFDVGELFFFVVDVAVAEGDSCYLGFEEVALFAF